MKSSKLWIVARFAFLKNLKSPAYYFTVLAPFIFLLVGAGIALIATNQKSEPPRIVLVDGSQADFQAIKAIGKDKFKLTKRVTSEQANHQFNHEKIDGYLKVNADYSKVNYTESSDASSSVSKKDMQSLLTSLHTAKKAQDYHLNAQQLKTLTQPTAVDKHIVTVKDGKRQSTDASQQETATLISQFVTYGIVILVMVYAGIMANEVGLEKGTKTLEGMLASVPPRTYLLGKILAVFGLVFVHILVYVVLYFLSRAVLVLSGQHALAKLLVIKDLPVGYIILVLVMGIISLLIYIILAAIMTSFVSRQEDIQRAITPLSFLVLIPYILAQAAIASPNAPLYVTLSYVPFFSQSMMPMRYAQQSATNQQFLLSIAIAAVFVFLLLWWAIKIYQKHALDYSDERPLKALTKALFKRSHKAN